MINIIAVPELKEDPQDMFMNYFINLSQNFSINVQHAFAIYIFSHGLTKLIVLWLLWQKKLWAYPLSVVVFGLFIAYEVYRVAVSPSLFLYLLIAVDVFMIVMIILEYKKVKSKISSHV